MNDEQLILLLEDMNNRLESISRQQSPDYRGEIRAQSETLENMRVNISEVKNVLDSVKQIDGRQIANTISFSTQEANKLLTKRAENIATQLDSFEARQAKFSKAQIRYYAAALVLGMSIGVAATFFSEYSALRTAIGCKFLKGEIYKFSDGKFYCSIAQGGQ